MIEITLEKAITSAKKAVERRGADYVYSSPVMSGACSYVHGSGPEDWSCGCMIGDMLINDFGVRMEDLVKHNVVGVRSLLRELDDEGIVECDISADENGNEPPLLMFLEDLQDKQDVKFTWGYALMGALGNLHANEGIY